MGMTKKKEKKKNKTKKKKLIIVDQSSVQGYKDIQKMDACKFENHQLLIEIYSFFEEQILRMGVL